MQLGPKYSFLVDWYTRHYAASGNSGDSSWPAGNSPRALLQFVGTISAYDLKVMADVIERECERIEDERSQ
jgi:hypothetical protein